MRRRTTAALAALAFLLLALGLLSGLGPALPGPHIRELLGLFERRSTSGCVVSPANVLSPARPRAATGHWRRVRSSPLARAELDSAVLDGLIYLVGGQGAEGRSLATVLTYDPRDGRFGRSADLPGAVDHPLVVAWHGSLYVVGGYVNSEPTDRVWRFSPGTERWTNLAPMSVARGGLAGAVIGDRLYAVGGAPRTFPEIYAKPFSILEIYDFATNRWRRGPDMPTPRHHTAAAALDGKLYVAGGRGPADFSLAAFERFDPRRNIWEELPPLPLGAGGAELVQANGEILVIGGDEEEGWDEGRGWVTPATWGFRTRSGRWRRLPNLNVARHSHAAAAVGDRVYVFEGSACPGFNRIRSVEVLSLQGTRGP